MVSGRAISKTEGRLSNLTRLCSASSASDLGWKGEHHVRHGGHIRPRSSFSVRSERDEQNGNRMNAPDPRNMMG